jgi:hypothetical protein
MPEEIKSWEEKEKKRRCKCGIDFYNLIDSIDVTKKNGLESLFLALPPTWARDIMNVDIADVRNSCGVDLQTVTANILKAEKCYNDRDIGCFKKYMDEAKETLIKEFEACAGFEEKGRKEERG